MASGIILCMCQASERRCYSVTPSLIGWAHTRNDLCGLLKKDGVLCKNFTSNHGWLQKVWSKMCKFEVSTVSADGLALLAWCYHICCCSLMKSWLIMFFLHKICTRPIGGLLSQFYSSLGCFYSSGTTGRVVNSNTVHPHFCNELLGSR